MKGPESPWMLPCGEGTWCASADTHKCDSCCRIEGDEDHFEQNEKCSTYSLRLNGYWPADHPNRMEREGLDGWNFVNREVKSNKELDN